MQTGPPRRLVEYVRTPVWVSWPLALASIACAAETNGLEPSLTIDGPSSVRPGQRIPLSALAAGFTPTAFEWRVVALPDGSTPALEAREAEADFVSNQRGAYEVVVRAVSTSTELTASKAIQVLNQQAVPRIDAPLRVARAGLVRASGSSSTDEDGDPISFEWTLNPPTGSSARLSDPAADVVTFEVDLPGLYGLQLVVHDGIEASLPAVVTILYTDQDEAPVAQAGPDQTEYQENLVILDGSASYDPDQDPIEFFWVLESPAGSTARLNDQTSPRTTFRPDLAGEYTATLLVTDPWLLSSRDSAQITVLRNPMVPLDELDPAAVYIFGTLSEGSCARFALASWEDPNRFALGFPCQVDYRGTGFVHPTSGRFVYLNEDRLLEFRCDVCPGAGLYPDAPTTNDVRLPDGPCVPSGPVRLEIAKVSPEGRFWYRCGSSSEWFQQGPNGLTFDQPYTLLGVGSDNVMLAIDGDIPVVVDLNLTTTASIGRVSAAQIIAHRSTRDGFYLAVDEFEAGARLLHVNARGETQVEGFYSPLDFGYFPQEGEAALDASGNLFQIASGPIEDFEVIIRREPTGNTTVVYDEGLGPAVRLHSSMLVTGP